MEEKTHKIHLGEHEKHGHSAELHALREHVVGRIENHAVSVIVERPHKLLALVVTLAAHAEVVAPSIDHKRLEEVVVLGGRHAERVEERMDGRRREGRIGIHEADREDRRTVRDFLSAWMRGQAGTQTWSASCCEPNAFHISDRRLGSPTCSRPAAAESERARRWTGCSHGCTEIR